VLLGMLEELLEHVKFETETGDKRVYARMYIQNLMKDKKK